MTAQQVQLLTDILDQLVIPVVGLVAAWAIAHFGLRQRALRLLARQDLVGEAARTAVAAVEQQLAGQAGAVKKQAAVGAAITLLRAHGTPITPAEEAALETAIEAAVRGLKPVMSAPPVVVNNAPPAAAPGPQAGPTFTATVAARDPTADKPVGAGTGVAS